MQGRLLKEISCVLVSASCFLILFLNGCSSSLELNSGWTDHKLAITGDGSHWKDATNKIAGPEVFVGVKNDDKNLYIGLITSNRETQLQMLALGCTAWFGPAGEKNKTFGIQFPVSGLLQGRRYPVRTTPEEIQRLVDAAQRQLTICGPGEKEQHRMSVQGAKGVEARLGYADGTLTYELKVPLQRTKEQPYAINADTTKQVIVFLETGDFAEAMKGQTGASSPSQSSGGRGRGGSRAGGGSGQSFANESPDPLKHWITIHLSSGSPSK
ncbi:MAG: hypothetical protein NTZ35_20285 [Ignavibacteriales bacterium]|nr:hypothetical protein [Ignavibacteriales bacterium]